MFWSGLFSLTVCFRVFTFDLGGVFVLSCGVPLVCKPGPLSELLWSYVVFLGLCVSLFRCRECVKVSVFLSVCTCHSHALSLPVFFGIWPFLSCFTVFFVCRFCFM